ncbi:MAG: hypothetical protein HUU28_04990 [Planctomycetaceae bacterium]|nr:hypothetical protein [Planctomycetaceae bacterium]
MRLALALGAIALGASLASAQVNRFTGGPPPGVPVKLDFDNPAVATGPIASNSPAFTAAGIVSITQFGTFTVGTDTLTPASNVTGACLVSQGGVMSVAVAPQALDNVGAGSGWEIQLAAPATTFSCSFPDQTNHSYSIELFNGVTSLGVGTFTYTGGFPGLPDYWTGPGPFDRITVKINTTAGVGLDNFAFDGVAPPVAYCTAGTTTNGCTASIGANANPSVAAASSCLIDITGVEGQKTGIVFYGLSALPQPWCVSGGTSFLCVKSPTFRSGAQATGGTTGACDGTLSLDWNAFQAANPGSLGSPFSVGNKVFVQGWFRDPPACKSTSLSNALEMTYVP